LIKNTGRPVRKARFINLQRKQQQQAKKLLTLRAPIYTAPMVNC